MIPIHELLKRLQQDQETQESFVVPALDELPDDDIVSLAACFALRGDIESVEIWRDGKPRGSLARSDFVDLHGILQQSVSKSFQTRGIGAGDPLSLPGDPNEVLVALCCPVDACDHRIYARRYRPEDAPDCPAHPGVKVEPCEGS